MNTILLLIELPLAGLALYATWCLLRDYWCAFHGPEMPAGPTDWALLEKGQVPAGNPDDVAREKKRLLQNCELQTLTDKCTVTSLSDVRPVR